MESTRVLRMWWWGNLVVVVGSIVLGFVETRFLVLAPFAFVISLLGSFVLQRRLEWRGTPLDAPIFVLMLMLPLTVAVTAHREITLEQVWRLLDGIVLFFSIVYALRTPRDVRLALMGVWLLVAGLALTSPVTAAGARPAWNIPMLAPLRGFIHHNVMGALLAMTFPLGMANLLFAGKRISRLEYVLYALGSVAMMVGLWTLPSRGAWLGVGIAILLLLTIHSRWGRLVVGVGILVAVVLVTTESGRQFLFSEALLGITVPNPEAFDPFQWGLEQRVEIWRRSYALARIFPLTGIGMGTFQETMRAVVIDDTFLYSWPHAHNIFLQVAVDLGLIGLIAWSLLLIGLGWCYFHMARADDRLVRAFGRGGGASLLAFVIHGLVDAPLWGMVRASVFTWLVWGLSMVMWNIHQHIYLSNTKKTPR